MSEKSNGQTNVDKPEKRLLHVFLHEWNDISENNTVLLFDEHESKEIFFGLPHPVQYVVSTAHRDDPYSVLLKSKSKYNSDVKKCTHYGTRSRVDLKTTINASVDNYVLLPKHVLLFGSNINDPDAYFSGDYNWYYTGGILDLVNIGNTKYLIRPNNSNDLLITNTLDAEQHYIVNSTESSQIYGVKATNYCNFSFTTIRKRLHLELYQFDSVDEFTSSKPIWSVSSNDVPFIDLKPNPSEQQYVSSLKADRTLEIHDIESGVQKFTFRFDAPDLSTDKLAQIEHSDNSTIIFMDRLSVSVVDERNALKVQKFNITDCNQLCTFVIFQGNIFVASKHHVFQLDQRNLGVSNKTFHLMDGCPFIMRPMQIENSSFMALANDRHKVVLNLSSGLPKEVPSILETFKETQLQGNFYLKKDIEPVIKCSTVGMHCEDGNIYTSNSRGELFEQKVFFEEPNKDVDERFNFWIDSIPDSETVLYHTGLIDMSKAKFALYSQCDGEFLNRLQKDSCIYSMLRFNTYKEGTYARDMEEVWLDEDESIEANVSVPEVTSVTKVSEWLINFPNDS